MKNKKNINTQVNGFSCFLNSKCYKIQIKISIKIDDFFDIKI